MIITTTSTEVSTVLNQVKATVQYIFNPTMEHYFNTPQVILGNVLKTNVMLYNREYLLHIFTEYNIEKYQLEVSLSIENRDTGQIAYTDTKKVFKLNTNAIDEIEFEDYIKETIDDMIKHF